jgi:dUTP pyrophosphatase
MSVLKVEKRSSQAVLPARATKGSAGYDLASAQDCTIPARGKGLVPTHLSLSLPEGCYGRIAPRSGIAWKNHIDVGAGVIDSDYRGEVGIVLFNHSDTDFHIAKGDRVAQLILEKHKIVPVVEVPTLRVDDVTERGEGGFGSTEKKKQMI